MVLESVEFAPGQAVKHTLPPHGISARFFCNIYNAFGIDVTDNLKQFTYGVCNITRIVDDAIDMPDVTTPPTFDALIDRVDERDIEGVPEADAVVSIRYVDSLNEDQLNFLRGLYLDALVVAEYRTGAQNVADYSKAIGKESLVAWRAGAVSETDTHHDAESRKRYNHWLREFTLAGYYIDAAVDLREDYDEGRTSFQPSITSRFALLKNAVSPGKEAIRRTPSTALPLLASLAIGFHIPKVNKSFSMSKIT